MAIRLSEYLKEGLQQNDENLRITLLGKACKELAEILPFKRLH